MVGRGNTIGSHNAQSGLLAYTVDFIAIDTQLSQVANSIQGSYRDSSDSSREILWPVYENYVCEPPHCVVEPPRPGMYSIIIHNYASRPLVCCPLCTLWGVIIIVSALKC